VDGVEPALLAAVDNQHTWLHSDMLRGELRRDARGGVTRAPRSLLSPLRSAGARGGKERRPMTNSRADGAELRRA
jgi:hypothetical protein